MRLMMQQTVQIPHLQGIWTVFWS